MGETLNVSFAEGQLAWLRGRKERDGFKTDAEVLRDLIRKEQELEAKSLLEEFRAMDAQGSGDVEPEIDVLKIVRRVKQERHVPTRRS